MASSSRLSYPGFPHDRVPSWLAEDFDDVLKPPSYLIASLQQAFDDYAFHHDPPTYEHSVGTATASTSAGTSSPSMRRVSLMGESIWEEDDDEDDIDESSADADDEDDGTEYGNGSSAGSEERHSGRGTAKANSDSQSTLYRMPLQDFPPIPSTSTSIPTPPQDDDNRSYRLRPLPPVPHIPPPAYHLLHLQHLMSKANADPYRELAQILSALDPELLLKPFAAFAEVCYEDAVRGDDAPPVSRPFSPPPVPSMSRSLSLTDESEDDDEYLLQSPTQLSANPLSLADTTSPPLVYEPRIEDRVRSTAEFQPLRIPRSMSSPALSREELVSSAGRGGKQYVRAAPDPMAEVASLFLLTPNPAKALNSVNGFPTRPRPPPQRAGMNFGNMRGMLLRSLNIS
ncbi:uncharacterized protein PHACADRAFT_260062 [Phanerochaete carnosa HHB-10118-sp]|uniref:Uncharacterized protein n=1 Tax=Phanerochaete carnosa (strain HHB-10118-sp) TaxID=650164 RepID=K5UUD7_PHACS|nr:uncharacterized protein PHACADRAFT_260062 [Phanerochaete carnosa HHB-10118-sp]EKM53616.1 hypothetical protein PHACADRAFT_260062 [Phanerochaete carnosa HHB-10118-sp]